MKKNIICLILLSLLLAAFSLPVSATAAGEEPWGTCGDEVAWSFEGDTLTISGSGAMYDFEDEAPWADYKDMIKKVVFTGGVTTVGWRSFTDYDNITDVDFGSSMHTVGAYAFKNCDGLVRVHLPSTFRIFDAECFCNCQNLKAIHCDGGAFPSFKGSCLWNTEATIYYPASNPWPLDLIGQLEDAFSHRIEFIDSDGNDRYISGYEKGTDRKLDLKLEELAEAEPETTAPETTVPETTVPETTVPETTVPETTLPETTVPETAEPETTEPETLETTSAPVWETVKPTEPPAQRTHKSSKTGLVLVIGMLIVLGISALVYQIGNKRRRDNW